ncbi:NAD(P)/FAD-dependent oxidoreductase [Jeotgalibacillus proteolyticus]|uniref:Ferredoxin--NADP reductase n=1 Tax=Jeotgalibacillus proteolyticus TaxID=2082395 RepID=A0A2S5GAR1_9BACL|nr:NAD(P)/FAD-dependent oxidoreductase [Jeotgalibacillus proteolyticus]PPA70015.1 ferredoxin--NADP(+) reductase [Jeotgalibacillus proteolyticus]
MKEDTQVYDITVIGGGPVGLFTAFYGGMRQASVKIIESLPQLGGQLSTLYPDKYIYDVAGFPKVRAQELVDNLVEQMDRFDTTVCLDQEVINVEKLEDGTFLLTTNEEIHHTRTIIITAGNGAFQARKLDLDGLSDFEDKNLHYFVPDLEKFRGRKVVLCGGGDSAVDWALMLEPIAESVTLIHRRDKFRAHEHSVEQLMNSSVNIMTPYTPVGYQAVDGNIKSLVLQKGREEEQVSVELDDLLINYGFVSSLGPIKNWDLEIEKNSIVVNSRMETTVPGIYAAGDICTYDGKVKLIASGFGEAPTAVNNAKASIDPKARVQPMHSTSMFE